MKYVSDEGRLKFERGVKKEGEVRPFKGRWMIFADFGE
jgi:hypothetical protein